MEKEKKKQIFVAVLCVISVMMLLNTFVFKNKKGTSVSPPASGTGMALDTGNISLLQVIRQNEGLRQAQAAEWEKPWGRDPFFEQQIAGAAGPSALHLSGIVWDEQSPMVILNNEMVKQGQEIAGYKVLEIRQGSVRIADAEGQQTELQLFEKAKS